jgi:hypothetical protein
MAPLIGSPRLRSSVATATWVTAPDEVCTNHREANTTAANPASMATASMMNARLFFMT